MAAILLIAGPARAQSSIAPGTEKHREFWTTVAAGADTDAPLMPGSSDAPTRGSGTLPAAPAPAVNSPTSTAASPALWRGRVELIEAGYTEGRGALLLWFLFAAVAAFVCLGLPLLAPLILYAPALTSSSRMGARRIAAVIGAGTSAIVLGWLLVTALAAHRPRFHEEAVGFLTVAEVCARGVRCPLVGQPMIYGIHLGPAFYQVLALLQLAADPRLAYFTLLEAQQLVAAALLGWAAHVALRGGPWGVVAAASLYFSDTFISQLQDPVHATLALLPGAGFVFAALCFARYRRTRDFVVANLCLAGAVQLHGILFPLLPALFVLGVVGRASRRAFMLAVLSWVLLFAPWLVFEARAHAYDLLNTFGFENALAISGVASRNDWPSMFDADLALPAMIGLGYAAFLVLRRGPRTDTGGGAFGVLVLGLTGLATAWLGRAGWSARYSLVLHLALAPALAAGPCAIWRAAFVIHARATRHRHLVLRVASGAAAAMAAAVAIDVLVRPLVARTSAHIAYAQTVLRTGGQPGWSNGDGGPLNYPDQKHVGAVLSAAGFGPLELDRHTHGPVWDRYTFLPHWLYDPSAAAVPPDRVRHAFLQRRCATMPGDFSVLPRPSTDTDGVTVAVYTPRLRVESAELIVDGTSRWQGASDGSIVLRRMNYLFVDALEEMVQLGRAWPEIALTPEDRTLLEEWRRPGVGTLIMRATLHPGGAERLIAVAHDVRLPLELYVDGAIVAPVEREITSNGNVEHLFFRPPPAPGDRAVELRVMRPDSEFPSDIELYEAPDPRCSG